MVATTSCRFLLLEIDNTVNGVGIFRYGGNSEGQVCSTFRHNKAIRDDLNFKGLSSAQKAAQFGGICSCILGFTATMLLFLSFCFRRFLSKCVWRIALPILLIAAGVIQSITFSIFADERCDINLTLYCDISNTVTPCPNVISTCTFSEGANSALAALVLYLFMGVSIIWYPKRTTPLLELVADEQVVTTTNKKMDEIEAAEDAYESDEPGGPSIYAPIPANTTNVTQLPNDEPTYDEKTIKRSPDVPSASSATTQEPNIYVPTTNATDQTTPLTTSGTAGMMNQDELMADFSSSYTEGTPLQEDAGSSRQRKHNTKSRRSHRHHPREEAGEI